MARRHYEKLKSFVFFLLIPIILYCDNVSSDCPKLCHCVNVRILSVDCSGKNLTAIPENIPEDVESL